MTLRLPLAQIHSQEKNRMYTNNNNKHTTELSLGSLPDSGRGLANTTVTVPYKDSTARAACPDPGRMGGWGGEGEGVAEETMGRLPTGLAKARLTAPSCVTRGWGHGGPTRQIGFSEDLVMDRLAQSFSGEACETCGQQPPCPGLNGTGGGGTRGQTGSPFRQRPGRRSLIPGSARGNRAGFYR